jgi:HEAT repeat protein
VTASSLVTPWRILSGKQKFDEQLSALEALRSLPAEARSAPLRKALTHRNNFVVAKAADLIREFQLGDLIPELLTAFDRFLENAEKSDPQCWAKNSLSRALAALEHQEPGVFLRGMRHIQMEPVWGGRSDTAGTLRATCALALVQCRSIFEPDLLAHLVDLLADKDKSVRTEVVRAIEQVGSPSAALILRVRAVLNADEPEVLGACYSAILNLEGVRSIPWISRFLETSDDTAAEAALAIAGTHSTEGLECLEHELDSAKDTWWRSVLFSAIALTRQDAALDFLLNLLGNESLDSLPVIDAIVRAMPSPDIIERVKDAVSNNPRLTRHLAQVQRPPR